jgi:hypothetical protein
MMVKKLGFGFSDSQTENRGSETGTPYSHPIAGVFVSIVEGKLRDP